MADGRGRHTRRDAAPDQDLAEAELAATVALDGIPGMAEAWVRCLCGQRHFQRRHHGEAVAGAAEGAGDGDDTDGDGDGDGAGTEDDGGGEDGEGVAD
jgi:hypothetical protein